MAAATRRGRSLVASLPPDRLREIMRQLNPRQRRIVEVRWLADEPMRFTKAADELHVPRSNFSSVEHYALVRVEKLLAADASPAPKPKAPKPPRPPKAKQLRAVRRRAVAWERDPVTRKQVPVRWEVF